MLAPTPCDIERVRYNVSPCKGDYIYECFDKNSLALSSSRQTAVTDCGCSTIFGGIISTQGSGYSMTMASGTDKGLSSLEHEGKAGISIYYKSVNSSCSGAPAAANIVETAIYDFSFSAVGRPIFGFAINVPIGVSPSNFTGTVLLFDYPNQVYRWGVYTNANLKDGAMPTTIGTIAMSTITPTSFYIAIDATAGNIYTPFGDVELMTSSQSEFIAHSTIALQSEPLGFGVIWVANHSVGNHIGRISVGQEDNLLWWG